MRKVQYAMHYVVYKMKDKKSKQRKKVSKKEKKKKDKKKHRNDSKSSKKGPREEDEFSSILSAGILNFPSLFHDFPAMIASMDSGQYVNIDNISDKKKSDLLHRIFSCLPGVISKDSNYGWHAINADDKVSSHILKTLLNDSVIKQPKELSQSETVASQKAPLLLLELLSKFPELLQEIPTLLTTLLDGNTIDVEDIENEDVRESLELLFKSLDLEYDDGYKIPSDGNKVIVTKAIEAIHGIFDTKALHLVEPSEASSSHGGSSANNSDNDDKSIDLPAKKEDLDEVDDEAEIEDESSKRALKGPAMPTREQLALAQSELQKLSHKITEAKDNEDDEEDEGDGEVGPRLYDPQKDSSLKWRQSLQKVLPLGFTGEEMERAMRTVLAGQPDAGNDSGGYVEDNGEEKKEINEREEWILTPGNSKLISELDSSVNTNRKFQTGKHAKQQLEELSRRKKQSGQTAGAQDESDAIMAQYREKRGPSLMEAHAEKRLKGPTAREKGRKAFDRDTEFLSHRSIDSAQIQSLVEKAKDMDSRFDRGSVQKSFL